MNEHTTFKNFLTWIGFSEKTFNILYSEKSSERLYLFLSYALSQSATDIYFSQEENSNKYNFGFRAAGGTYKIKERLTHLDDKIFPTIEQNNYMLTIYLFGLDNFSFRFRVAKMSNTTTHIVMRRMVNSDVDNTQNHILNLSDGKIDSIEPLVHSLLLEKKLQIKLAKKQSNNTTRQKI